MGTAYVGSCWSVYIYIYVCVFLSTYFSAISSLLYLLVHPFPHPCKILTAAAIIHACFVGWSDL